MTRMKDTNDRIMTSFKDIYISDKTSLISEKTASLECLKTLYFPIEVILFIGQRNIAVCLTISKKTQIHII